MMRKDWSIFRITILLYAIVVLLPLNYYFANRSFESMQNDGVVMNQLVNINGTIQRIIRIEESSKRDELIVQVESSFKSIDREFLQAPVNTEYVELFRANENYDAMINVWMDLKMALNDKDLLYALGDKSWREVNSFSHVAEEMLTYKSEMMLDRLYLSLILTMLIVVFLVYMVRLYIHIQLRKHAIHDHVTGLYNRKYYIESLQKAKLLASRQDSSLSLLILSFEQYEEVKNSLGKKEFDSFLQEFSKQFREFFRQSDTICRIDANSFVAITPDLDEGSSNKFVERLEERLSLHEYGIKKQVELRIGIAQYHKDSGMALLEESNEVMKRNALVTLGGAV